MKFAKYNDHRIYEIKAIKNCGVYAKKSLKDYLSELYHLKGKNIQESVLAVQHL